MSVDRFLLRRAEEEGGVPVLRLYSFDPPAVTVGFHQDPGKVLDLIGLERDGIDVVRRVTGGRALLHDREQTYSITAPLGSPWFTGPLHETFLDISAALAGALRKVGINAEISGGTRHHTGGDMVSPCLVSTSRYELTVKGRKIAGSAQRRTKNAFLQHGSILLGPGSEKISNYIEGDWDSISEHVTSIEDEAGNGVSGEALREALVGSFAERFGVEFEMIERPETEQV
jgi:lipoate-protein ligase A